MPGPGARPRRAGGCRSTPQPRDLDGQPTASTSDVAHAVRAGCISSGRSATHHVGLPVADQPRRRAGPGSGSPGRRATSRTRATPAGSSSSDPQASDRAARAEEVARRRRVGLGPARRPPGTRVDAPPASNAARAKRRSTGRLHGRLRAGGRRPPRRSVPAATSMTSCRRAARRAIAVAALCRAEQHRHREVNQRAVDDPVDIEQPVPQTPHAPRHSAATISTTGVSACTTADRFQNAMHTGRSTTMASPARATHLSCSRSTGPAAA